MQGNHQNYRKRLHYASSAILTDALFSRAIIVLFPHTAFSLMQYGLRLLLWMSHHSLVSYFQ